MVSITSPDLASLATRMAAADPVAAYHRAAMEVGSDFESALATAFEDAGAADDLIDTVGTYMHPDGSMYVGIPASSGHAGTAHDMEYGTPFQPPHAPVRNTTESFREDAEAKLAQALDRALGEEMDGAF